MGRGIRNVEVEVCMQFQIVWSGKTLQRRWPLTQDLKRCVGVCDRESGGRTFLAEKISRY